MIQTADLTSRARELEASGNLAEAIDLYQDALNAEGNEDSDASLPFLLVHIADLHRRRGDDARAFEFYRRAADGYTDQGLLSNAISVWVRVRENYPDRPESYLALTRLHCRVGLEDEAASDLETYLELAREANRLEDARRELESLLAVHPVPELTQVAGEFLQVEIGRSEAKKVFDAAAERRENEGEDGAALRDWLTEWRDDMSTSENGAEQPREAPVTSEKEQGQAVPRMPDSAEGLGAEAELRRGLELLNELLELQPDNVELRRRKVRYAERIGELDLRHEAYLDLADALARKGEERAARLLYENVLQERPGDSRARAKLARIESDVLEGKQRLGSLQRRGDGDEETAEELDPEQVAAKEELSQRLWREFEASLNELPWLHAATQAYQAVGSDGAPPVEAFEMLGHYLIAQGKLKDAAQVLDSGLTVADGTPDPADLLYNLVVVYRKLGDREAADRYLKRLADYDDEVRALLTSTRLGPNSPFSDDGGTATGHEEELLDAESG